jgi:hypothetical protein
MQFPPTRAAATVVVAVPRKGVEYGTLTKPNIRIKGLQILG